MLSIFSILILFIPFLIALPVVLAIGKARYGVILTLWACVVIVPAASMVGGIVGAMDGVRWADMMTTAFTAMMLGGVVVGLGAFLDHELPSWFARFSPRPRLEGSVRVVYTRGHNREAPAMVSVENRAFAAKIWETKLEDGVNVVHLVVGKEVQHDTPMWDADTLAEHLR